MSNRAVQVLAALVATATLSGCTLSPSAKHWIDNTRAKFTQQTEVSTPDEAAVPVKSPKRYTGKPERTNRELTLAWDNIGRAGAAVHQPDYVHVLDGRVDGHLDRNSDFGLAKDYLSHGADGLASGTGTDLNARSGGRKGQGYSFYELQRWERYCDAGKGMDERDWIFVASQLYKAPLDVLSSCRPPAYDYTGYLESWKRFCARSPLYDQKDVQVVRNSVRPTQLASRCSRVK